jgi:ABC-type lipoprotein release transport system permease subunit
VALVSESLARQFWPDTDALKDGLILGTRNIPNASPLQIVGIVKDVHDEGLDQGAAHTLYVPLKQTGNGFVGNAVRSPVVWVVRTRTDAHAVATPIKEEVERVSRLPITKIRTMDETISASIARRTFNTVLLGSFGTLSILLATIGLYGSLSFSVNQRAKEIGIRLSLGADQRGILRLIISRGMRLALAGILLGMIGAVAISRILAEFLFNVEPRDAIVFTLAPVLLGAVAFFAVLFPAYAASRIDAVRTLRCQ